MVHATSTWDGCIAPGTKTKKKRFKQESRPDSLSTAKRQTRQILEGYQVFEFVYACMCANINSREYDIGITKLTY